MADDNLIDADGETDYYTLAPGQKDAHFGRIVPETPPLFVRASDVERV